MAEDRLEKLVRRYQKAAEKKTAGESIGANVTNMLFRSGKTSAAKVFAKTAAPKNLHLYDGTAPDAVDQLASSLLAELTPAWAKWFGLRAGSELNETERAQVAPVLEKRPMLCCKILNIRILRWRYINAIWIWLRPAPPA